MIWLIALIIFAISAGTIATYFVWMHPGNRTLSEKIAETGLVIVVPVFGSLVSFCLSYYYCKDPSALDNDPIATLGGAAGAASSIT
jgi:fructose-specific phosphotransferase system IIC component